MPLTLPPFGQYQSPIVPLRGLWRSAPREGDFFVNIEIDWAIYLAQGVGAVQLQFAGNSPVAMSQIVALAVDNSRCGADIQFQFPDSGSELAVPSHEGGVFPCFTNALMFYVIGGATVPGDISVFQVCNSMPPPVALSATFAQNHASATGIGTANGTTPIIAAGTSGTLNTISLSIELQGGAAIESLFLSLVDGTGRTVWVGVYNVPAGGVLNQSVNLPGLALRFADGLGLMVSASSVTSGYLTANLYYSTP